MIRFPCFLTPLHNHKSKKISQQASGTMQLNSLLTSQDLEIKFPEVPTSSNVKADEDNILVIHVEQTTCPSSQEGYWKPHYCSEDSQDFLLKAQDRKSKPLGNALDKVGSFHVNMVKDDELDKGFSFHDFYHSDMNKLGNIDAVDRRRKFQNQNHESNKVEFHNFLAGLVHHESLFSIGTVEQSEGKHHDNADQPSLNHVRSGQFLLDIRPNHVKSCFLTSLMEQTIGYNNGSLKLGVMGSHSRSSENLFSINAERVQFLYGDKTTGSRVTLNGQEAASDAHYMSHESELDEWGSTCHSEFKEEHLSNDICGSNELSDPEKDGRYFISKSNGDYRLVERMDLSFYADSVEKYLRPSNSLEYYDMDDQEREGKWYKEHTCESPPVDGNDLNGSDGHAIEWLQSQTDGAGSWKLKESFAQGWDEPTSEELNSSRVAAWVSQLNVQNDIIVKELEESSNSISRKSPLKAAGITDNKKVDSSSGLGMMVAYNYISNLSPTSSTAQMANIGLIAIPVLSAFFGLRMLNLSGNAIVRITVGTLPKGLHMLNLSKNNISAIEGLRELTRLRILDLSYNKISRIGHGLACCSTMRELYLAGNKISEIEGLQRLLKLSILDLRFNRISTSKCLGQLTANYASLQAINLEGNPAQKNVGEEQLKKYLLGLLPHLAYYNKQVIRASGSKEVPGRFSRSCSTPQFDRSFRSEHKESHRGNYGMGLCKSSYGHIKSGDSPSSSIKSSSSRQRHDSLSSSIKSSSSRQRHPAPVGPKPTNHAGRNLLGFQPSNLLWRIQSEGDL